MAFCNSRNSSNQKKSGIPSSSSSSIRRQPQGQQDRQMGDPPEAGGSSSSSSVAAACLHKEVMKDLCVQCGQDIRRLTDEDRKTILQSASISMIHSIPELKISQESAEQLGRADEERLLRDRKLILLVDLDQTIIHTTNDPSADHFKSSDFFHFQLDQIGHHAPVYHTKTRPRCQQFLHNMAQQFELHIVTFGSRMYAHEVARFLDPQRKLFSHRILSRDECISAHSKTANLKELFPCGDSLVCIIDDREDVWNFAPNVVPVRPYQFFTNTGDINSPFKASEGNFFHQQQQHAAAAVAVTAVAANPHHKDVMAMSSDLSASSSSTSSKTNHPAGDDDEDPLTTGTAQSEKENDDGQSKQVEVVSEEVGDNLTSGEGEDDAAAGKEDGKGGESVQEQVQEVKQQCPEGESQADGERVKKEEETDSDVYLAQLEEILKKIHKKFYQEYDEKQKYRHESEPIKVPDLKEIIPKIRKQVLHGCTIVFSGVIPNGVPTTSSRIHRLATSLGAKVSDSVVTQKPDVDRRSTQSAMFAPQERTTHVVASKFGTLKVRSAQKDPRIKVVNPLWLYACAENWERVSEDLHLLKADEDYQSHPLVAAEKKLLSSSSRDPAPAASFRNSSSPQSPASSTGPVGTSKEPPEELGDGLMEHPLNQLSMFSSRDLQCMDKEVEDACSEGDDMFDDSSDDDDKTAPNVTLKRMRESSSEESMDGECPKGWQSSQERRKKVSLSPSPDEEEDQGTVDSEVAFGPAGGLISSESSSESSPGSSSSGSLDGAADMLEREFLGS